MKKSILSTGLIGLSVFLLTLSIWSVPQHQAEATTMSPTRLELNGDAGKTIETSIKIYNDEKIARTLYLSAAKFETKDETGDPEFVPEERDGLVSWFSFPDSIQIGAQQYKEIPVSINIPNDAKPGGYFAAVFASVIPPAPEGNGDVAVKTDVGTLVLFRVNGQFPTEDSLLEFGIKGNKHWFANLPVEFYFRFQNSGADRAQPLGDIMIRNIFGGVSKIITANKGAGNVLPESVRKFESGWVDAGSAQVDPHSGKVDYPKLDSYWAHVKYEWNNFTFGRYNAKLQVTVNNDSSRSHTKSLVFWIVPWHLLLLILAVAIVFFTLVVVVVLGIVLIFFRKKNK